MKIRLRTTMAGPGGTAAAGTVADLPAPEAIALVKAGYAAAMDAPPVESAAIAPPETAALPRAPAHRARR